MVEQKPEMLMMMPSLAQTYMEIEMGKCSFTGKGKFIY